MKAPFPVILVPKRLELVDMPKWNGSPSSVFQFQIIHIVPRAQQDSFVLNGE
jgi:hypothetical protein